MSKRQTMQSGSPASSGSGGGLGGGGGGGGTNNSNNALPNALFEPAVGSSPLLGKWRDRFQSRNSHRASHEIEISGPILEDDSFERSRRQLVQFSENVT